MSIYGAIESSPFLGSTSLGKKIQFDLCVLKNGPLSYETCKIQVYGWGSIF